MKFLLERVTHPAIEPITLAQMKTHLREFSSVTALDDDITALIQGAREWVEDFTGRALIDQTWRLTLADDDWFQGYTDSNTVTPIYYGTWFPSAQGIFLRKSPVLEITSFATVDAGGIETVIQSTAYEVREAASKWPRLVGINSGPWSGPMRITFRAGYANQLGSPTEGVEKIPARFIQAMKLWAEAHYNRDEKTMELLLDVAERLINPERCELGVA